MTKLPYKPESAVKKPTALKGVPNGMVPTELLKLCGIRSFVMVEPAASQMRAMIAHAWRSGVRLSATGTYRNYATQKALFLKRYSTTPTYPTQPFKEWDGAKWYLKRGVPGAATPGKSNHGWGLAVDFARRNSAGRVVSLDGVTLKWLAEFGPTYGYWNTVESEVWHWCYCLGDQVPQ